MEELIARIQRAPVDPQNAEQRAQFYKSLVYLGMRRERFALSEQTVAYARQRLDASEQWGVLAEIVEAAFAYALALLFHGNVSGARDEILARLPEADRQGNLTLLSRLLAYLAIAHRMGGEVAQARAVAERCVEVARASGMEEYVSTGRACLGWAAYRLGDVETARRECESALSLWTGGSFSYPFEWLARLVLFALDSAVGSRDKAIHASRMLDAKQHALPQALVEALEQAATSFDCSEADKRVVRIATDHGFL
jgi:tetratricopeptide (TPR) repeat protein